MTDQSLRVVAFLTEQIAALELENAALTQAAKAPKPSPKPAGPASLDGDAYSF
jgi:hypothetical protein